MSTFGEVSETFFRSYPKLECVDIFQRNCPIKELMEIYSDWDSNSAPPGREGASNEIGQP
jgi:hypothetical protein